MMKAFDFTLKFSLRDPEQSPEDYINALYQAGCDDALIGIGKRGRIALTFNRKANTADEAVQSAVLDVLKAIPDAKLIEATPDLVGITDIASFVGKTRQYIRKLEIQKASFPAPVYNAGTSLWHLHSVIDWFIHEQNYRELTEIKEIAEANMKVNLANELSLATHAYPDGLPTQLFSAYQH